MFTTLVLMDEFYKSKEFQKLNRKWRKKLKSKGFDDIEAANKPVKQDVRTFKNIEETQSFFIMLDHFLYCYPDMPKEERKVMELYSKGVYIKNISTAVNASYSKVQKIIYRYEQIVRAVNRFILNTDFSLPLEASELGPRGYRESDPFKF